MAIGVDPSKVSLSEVCAAGVNNPTTDVPDSHGSRFTAVLSQLRDAWGQTSVIGVYVGEGNPFTRKLFGRLFLRSVLPVPDGLDGGRRGPNG